MERIAAGPEGKGDAGCAAAASLLPPVPVCSTLPVPATIGIPARFITMPSCAGIVQYFYTLIDLPMILIYISA